MTPICISNLTIIGWDNGLSPGRHQAIIWTNAGVFLIGPWESNFSEHFDRNSYIFIQETAFENVVCKMAVILPQPQCHRLLTFATKEDNNIFIRVTHCQYQGCWWSGDTNSQGISSHYWCSLNQIFPLCIRRVKVNFLISFLVTTALPTPTLRFRRQFALAV